MGKVVPRVLPSGPLCPLASNNADMDEVQVDGKCKESSIAHSCCVFPVAFCKHGAFLQKTHLSFPGGC